MLIYIINYIHGLLYFGEIGENMDKIENKNGIFDKVLFLMGLAGVLILNIVAWKNVDFCDWYIENIFPIWLNTYARLTSMVNISVGEIMLILAAVITIIGFVIFIVNIFVKNRLKTVVRHYGCTYAWVALIVCYIMTFNCFIMYHATGFSQKYLENERKSDTLVVDASENAVIKVNKERKGTEFTKKEIAALRDYVVDKCNSLAVEIPRDDSGAPYYDGDIVGESVKAMQKLGQEYSQLDGFYVKPKYLACSEFFSQQYIMGYYFPFSMEANINSMMYITNVAPTVCHELAHTKGFIFEDDANMIGYLACINSEDKFLQYCGYLSVLNYVNKEFYSSIGNNKAVYKKHVRISDRVADDNVFLSREDWQVVEKKAVIKTSTVKKVSTKIMDTTLKINGVDEGIKQYNGVVGQLLKYYDGELY